MKKILLSAINCLYLKNKKCIHESTFHTNLFHVNRRVIGKLNLYQLRGILGITLLNKVKVVRFAYIWELRLLMLACPKLPSTTIVP
jgi:hypothetical protein